MNYNAASFLNIFDPIVLFFWLGLVVLIFLILREVFCWYWKINKIVNLLEKIEKNTKQSKLSEQKTETEEYDNTSKPSNPSSNIAP